MKWSHVGLERGRMLTRAAGLMRERLEEIARLDVQDNGKPIWEARADMEVSQQPAVRRSN